MSDIERQLEDFLKEKKINFNIDEKERRDIGKKYFHKFMVLAKKAVVLAQTLNMIKTKLPYLSEEKKNVFQYLEKYILYKEGNIQKSMAKIEKLGDTVDMEELNITLYDFDCFMDKTFNFINSYFFDSTLADSWKF